MTLDSNEKDIKEFYNQYCFEYFLDSVKEVNRELDEKIEKQFSLSKLHSKADRKEARKSYTGYDQIISAINECIILEMLNIQNSIINYLALEYINIQKVKITLSAIVDYGVIGSNFKKINSDKYHILKFNVIYLITLLVFLKYLELNNNINLSKKEFDIFFKQYLVEIKKLGLNNGKFNIDQKDIDKSWNIIQILSGNNLRDYVVYSHGVGKHFDPSKLDEFKQLYEENSESKVSLNYLFENNSGFVLDLIKKFKNKEEIDISKFFLDKNYAGKIKQYYYSLLFGEEFFSNKRLEVKNWDKILTRHAVESIFTPYEQGIFDPRFLEKDYKGLKSLLEKGHKLLSQLGTDNIISQIVCGLQVRIDENSVQEGKFYAIIPGKMLDCTENRPVGKSQKGTDIKTANNLCMIFEPTEGKLISEFPVTDEFAQSMREVFNLMTISRLNGDKKF